MTRRFSGISSRGTLVAKGLVLVAMLVATQGLDCPIIPDPTADLCADVTCDPGETCMDGLCVADDLCADVTCDPGFECVDGTCEPIPAPAVSVAASASNAAPQVGDTVNLLATVSNGNAPFVYQWSQTAGPAGAVLANADQQTAQATFSAEGTFTFNVFVSDTVGSAQSTVDVVVAGGASQALTFTLGTDSLVGSSGDDTFSAPFEFSGGNQVPTLQAGDTADGAGGIDTLNFFFNAATFAPSGISNIEILNTTQVTLAGTLNLANVTGLTALNNVNSTVNLAVTGVADVTSAGIQGVLTNTLTTGITYVQAATAGLTDAMALTVSSINAGAFTYTTVGDGFETLNVTSDGAIANILADIIQGGVTTDTLTANFAGAQLLTVTNTLDNSITTIDASASTGGVVLGAGTGNVAFTGGSGDDTIAFLAGQFDTNDSADGGAGTDTISVASAQAASTGVTRANASNFEVLSVSDTVVAASIVPTEFGPGITKLVAAAGFTPGPGTVTATSGFEVEVTADQGGGNAQTFSVSGVGTTDTWTLTIGGLAAVDAFGGAANFTGIETLNVVSQGTAANTTTGAITITPSAGVASGTLNISGNQGLTLGGNTTANPINASSFTGALTLTLAGASAFTGGSGVNTITGSGANDSILGGTGNDVLVGGAGSDVINGGGGNDIITGGAGDDVITGGSGTDVFTYTTETDSLNTALDRLQDFTSGTDNFDTDAAPTSSGAATGGVDLNARTTASTGVTAGTLATDIATALVAAGGNAAMTQAGDTLVVTLTGNSIGGSGAVYVVIESGVAGYAAGADAVVLLEGTSSTTLVIGDFQ